MSSKQFTSGGSKLQKNGLRKLSSLEFNNLLPRFHHVGSGHIRLDGHTIEDLTLASLRTNIALVSQDVVLFNDTIG